MRVDLCDHAAVACTNKDGIFDAELLKECVHSNNQFLIGAQFLGIVKQKNTADVRQSVHVIHPHSQRIHSAV